MVNAERNGVQAAIDSLVQARSALHSEAKTTREKRLLAAEIDDILRRLKAIQPYRDGDSR